MHRFIFKIVAFVIFSIQTIYGEWALDAAPKFGNTRTLSMGGVTIASGSGIDAFSGNPGGLARIRDIQISITSGLQIWGKRDEKTLKPFYQLKNAGIVFPFSISHQNISFAGAIGYRSFYNCDRKIKRSYYTNTTTGLVDVFSMGFGIHFSSIGSLGMILHIPVKKTYAYQWESYYYRYEFAGDVTSSKIIQFGGIIDMTSKWMIGFSCLMNHNFTINTHDIGYPEYLLYSEKREMPWTCDFGIAYKASPNLLIAADIQNRPWEHMRINDQKISDVKSGNAYRIGIEWGHEPIFRAGYARDILPAIDSEGDPVDINNLTIGLGFPLSLLVIDVGFSYQFDHIYVKNNIHELVFNMTVTCLL